jgi:hypothetical protein
MYSSRVTMEAMITARWLPACPQALVLDEGGRLEDALKVLDTQKVSQDSRHGLRLHMILLGL